jgi:hypothetical protein
MLLLCWSVAYALHQRLIVNTFLKDFLKNEFHDHRRNFATIIGGMEGGISTMDITNFNLQRNQFRKRGKFGFVSVF